MSAPAAPIDADFSEADKVSYFVLEEAAIWLTQNLGGGSATWTKVFDAATFLAAYPGYAELELLRICCSVQTANKVYILAWAKLAAGASVGDAYLFRSVNNGATWSYHYIANQTARSYSVTYRVSNNIAAAGNATIISDHTPRIGDAEVANNPLAVVITHHWSDAGAWLYFGRGDGGALTGDILNSTSFNDLDQYTHVAFQEYDTRVASAAALDAYFGPRSGGNWISWGADGHGWFTFLKETARTKVTSARDHCGTTGYFYHESWVFWNKPSVPRALAVSRNSQAIYVGCEDQIYKSLDDGFTWTAMPTAEGATDILVDPLLGGVIYYWCTDGNLKQAIGDIAPATIMMSTRQDNYGTIARDWLSGKVYAIDPLGNVKSSTDFITWSTLYTGLSSGRAMKAYYASPTKLVLVDALDIHQSVDGGANWTKKQGLWDANVPKTIHLLPEP
jgi:hypothetical protein